MTTLLLTGATGLIGSSLRRMLASKLTVTAKSRSDFTTNYDWYRLPSYDYIIHAAGYASPARFLAEPLNTAFLNTSALLTLLGKLNPGGRLLFLSTSEVYSGCNTKAHDENDIGTTSPNAPRGIYIESKRCGEAICHAARESGITAISARVSLAYGPGVKRGDKRVMSELIDQALKVGVITMKDGGQAQRSYCYVDDISTMLLNILMKGTQSLYNVAGNSATTIHGLAQRIGRITGAQVRLPYSRGGNEVSTVARGNGERCGSRGGGMDGAPQRVTLSMNRYTREFGEPSYVGWDEGLAKTIAWHRELAGVKERAVA